LIDLHTHILPGFDDGAQSWPEARQMLEIAEREGIRLLFATPHFIETVSEPKPEEIAAGVAALNRYAQLKGLAIRVLPGLEAALSPALPELVAAGRLIAQNREDRLLLVELPALELPPYTDQVLFQLQLAGVTPVLAHPERNRRLLAEPWWLEDAVSRGIKIQITADSLLGRFGRQVQKASERMLAEGLVHGLGSDAHSPRHRSPRLREAALRLIKLLGKERARAIVRAEALAPCRWPDPVTASAAS